MKSIRDYAAFVAAFVVIGVGITGCGVDVTKGTRAIENRE